MNLSFLTIVMAVVAVIVFYQLYRALGKRTGHERPPVDPFSIQPDPETQAKQAADNVVALPRDVRTIEDEYADIDKVADEGTPVNQGLRTIRGADSSFAVKSFLDGVRIAYEMIVTAFANGDRTLLKDMLSKEVYEGFVNAIDAREKSGESVKFTFIGLDKVSIVDAELNDREAQITLSFASEIISATYDSKGECVDGDEEAIVEVKDRWTFARNISSRDPNWKLIATQEDS